MEIVPLFLEMVDEHTGAMTQGERFPFFARLYTRLGEGMRKYGKVLVSNNGRDSLMDAWEEACDGSQYLLQAYCEGHLTDPRLMHDQIRIMVRLERMLFERELDGRTETNIEARGGPTQSDAEFCPRHDPF